MKTKEQILDWLDKQPWANEFYKEAFFDREFPIIYDKYLISRTFDWAFTKSGINVWKEHDSEFRRWYDSNDKPMSWEEYCKQNPIKAGDSYINEISEILSLEGSRDRDEDDDVNVMPEYLCKAFLAYMKLIQLRNAWVKDYENGDKNLYRIVWSPSKGFWCFYGGWKGLSFPMQSMAEEFINTFKDLLEVAKPLI